MVSASMNPRASERNRSRPDFMLTLPSWPSQPRLRSQPVIRDSFGSILRPAGSPPMARDSKREWTRVLCEYRFIASFCRGPLFNDLSVGDTGNVDLLGLERLAGRLETDELSCVSPTRNHADDDF